MSETRIYIWLLEQEVATGYDTYDSAVVVAATEEDAQRIHPKGTPEWSEAMREWLDADGDPTGNDTWCRPEQVTAIKIGVAAADVAAGDVLCSSFNAG